MKPSTMMLQVTMIVMKRAADARDDERVRKAAVLLT
jgi:hypothetical protein